MLVIRGAYIRGAYIRGAYIRGGLYSGFYGISLFESGNGSVYPLQTWNKYPPLLHKGNTQPI